MEQEKGRRGMRMMTANRLRHRRARTANGKLCCEHCHRPIHRHDRYTIVKVVHKNCSDPKLVGQKSLEIR